MYETLNQTLPSISSIKIQSRSIAHLVQRQDILIAIILSPQTQSTQMSLLRVYYKSLWDDTRHSVFGQLVAL